MIPASLDYQDPADTERGWDDDENTSVNECVHGEHPIECSLCTSAGLIAAVSGEGEDMQDPDKSHWNGRDDVSESTIKRIDEWIAIASVKDLKMAYYAIEREVERRKDEVAREAKALETFEKPVRATRKDKGTTRARKEQAA